ncbi:hypothetical protein [Sphingomonas soli]|uniref:hypothetical protein n=1 Tax=Sphingomonas soli TaxID=266127 RepID=UPI00082F8E55|nr:hypothetical protein [Sphingomonas soli]
MIGKAIAAYIGNRIDRRDGKGGTLGALAGMAAFGLGKRALPAAIVLGAAAYGARALQKRRGSAR